MGYSQSKDTAQQILEPVTIKSIGDQINNHMRHNRVVASSTIINSFSNPSSSCYNASFSSQSNSLTSKCQLISPKLDIAVIENENPIQRRRRIMSGDRRTCYVMKLESIRQARLGSGFNDSRQLSTVASYGIVSKVSTTNDLCKNTNYSNLAASSYKPNATCKSGSYEQNHNTNISVAKESNELKSISTNKESTKLNDLTSTFISSDLNSESGPNNYTTVSPTEETLVEEPSGETNLNNLTAKLDNWTVIVDKIKEKQTQVRTVSLPNQLDRFSMSYNPEKVFNKCIQNEDKDVAFSCLNEEGEHPFISENKNIMNDVLFDETNGSSQISSDTYEKTKNNTKDKSIFDMISLPVGIFTNCFNAGIHNTNSDSCNVPGNKNINPSNFNAIITFESDYTDNGFDSDSESCCTKSDKNLCDSKNIPGNDNENKNNTDIDSSERNNSKNSSKTFLSYKRVKTLFQKRIAEIEQEEKKKVMNNSYYKELEELGRGHWKNGVWMPFAKAKNPKKCTNV